jgi:hypothetical protein
MSNLTKEIKGQLFRYVSGELALDAFHNWFAVMLRDVHESNDYEAEALAHAIEWTLCDLERGTSLREVRERLVALSNPSKAIAASPILGACLPQVSVFDAAKVEYVLVSPPQFFPWSASGNINAGPQWQEENSSRGDFGVIALDEVSSAAAS